MLALALDTSTPMVSVAVADGVDVIGSAERLAPNRHGEVLASLVAEVLAAIGARPADLGTVTVGVGPGPYTGLRVGLVTAAATADALGVPVRAVCSLDVTANGPGRPWADGFTVMSDARRREVYWARYADGRRVAGPAVDKPAAVAAGLPDGEAVVGAGALLYAETFADRQVVEESPYPRAADLAVLGMDDRWVVDFAPMYLRRPDAKPPGAPKRVTPA